jgi:hypothetical protein
VRCKTVYESAWIVEDVAARFDNNLRDPLGIFVLPQQIRDNPRWSSYRETLKRNPLIIFDLPNVDTDILAPCLAPDWEREFVPVGGKVPESVQGCGRTVRHDALFCCSLPRGHFGCQLEPGCPEVSMIWDRRPRDLVDTMGDSLQSSTWSSEAFHSG